MARPLFASWHFGRSSFHLFWKLPEGLLRHLKCLFPYLLASCSFVLCVGALASLKQPGASLSWLLIPHAQTFLPDSSLWQPGANRGSQFGWPEAACTNPGGGGARPLIAAPTPRPQASGRTPVSVGGFSLPWPSRPRA